MKYRKAAVYAVTFLILCVLFIAFFCILAFSSSYGYSPVGKDNDLPVSNLNVSEPITIVIDPGHGGVDPGAVANNLIEKDLNLSVSLKLKNYLELSGYKVLLTRSIDALPNDTSYGEGYKRQDLESRLSFLENEGECIFVSIHMNKFDSPSAHGLQTFYSKNNDESLYLAECIQTASLLIDENNKRTVKPDDGKIFILENTYKPAVLVECGFISNATDAKNLNDSAYQNKLAFSIYGGIIKYLGE